MGDDPILTCLQSVLVPTEFRLKGEKGPLDLLNQRDHLVGGAIASRWERVAGDFTLRLRVPDAFVSGRRGQRLVSVLIESSIAQI